MGSYNVGVGVLHRGPTKPGAPVGAIMHEKITEVYYVVSGSGTLLTGGVVENPGPRPPTVRSSEWRWGQASRTFKEPAQRRKVSAGDIVTSRRACITASTR